MKRVLLIALVLICSDVFALAVYKMKEGDTISDVLHKNTNKKLYGEKELVDQTLALNGLSDEQAKDLEPGKIVYLPLTTHYAPKKWNLQVDALMYFQEMELEEGRKARFKSNFGAKAKVLYKNSWYGELSIIQNQDLEVLNDQNITGSFSPSYEALIGRKFSYGRWSFIPYLQYGYFPALEQEGENIFIRRDHTAWIGSRAQHDFSFKKNKVYVSGDLSALAFSSVRTNAINSESLKGFRAGLGAGLWFFKGYNAEIFFKRSIVEASGSKNQSQIGASLGHIF